MGRPPRLFTRTANRSTERVDEKQLAMSLPAHAFKDITWREGAERKLRSRFAAVRVAQRTAVTEKPSLAPRNGY